MAPPLVVYAVYGVEVGDTLKFRRGELVVCCTVSKISITPANQLEGQANQVDVLDKGETAIWSAWVLLEAGRASGTEIVPRRDG